MPEKRFTRREWLAVSGVGLAAALTGLRLYDHSSETKIEPWPTDPEIILKRIKELNFQVGSELRTTVFPRKIMWEAVQVLKARDEWAYEIDESDWFRRPDIFEEHIARLAANGIKGGRLEVVPFELTQDGINFDYAPLEKAIEIMARYNMAVDLCLGPLDYPYYPGIRLPINLERLLGDTFSTGGVNQIIISDEPDLLYPSASQEIKDFALRFLQETLSRYGHDPRIEKLYLGNEWPDEHGIEGIDGTMNVSHELMQEFAQMIMDGSDKKVAINTNIHPTQPGKFTAVLGQLLNLLGERGVLGLDVYPTRENQIRELSESIPEYANLINELRRRFPNTDLVFTEFQAEPWPPEGIAGQSWIDIFRQHPEIFIEFFQRSFPPSLESHIIASGITEVGLWGAPAWLSVDDLEYIFPLEMMQTIAETMEDEKVVKMRSLYWLR